MLKRTSSDFSGSSGGSEQWAIFLNKSEMPEVILLTPKEWSRLASLVMREWGKSEAEVLQWINDDAAPTWDTEDIDGGEICPTFQK